jgi:hypothetical protein
MPEFRVLSFLEEEANLYGIIEALQSKSIATDCEIAENSVFRILRQLQNKKFILSRTNRFKNSGEQVSNGYKLDLERYFPAGETQGTKIWSRIQRELGDGAAIHAEGSQAYYSTKTRNLTVWLEGGRELRFFDRMMIKTLLSLGRTFTPKIRYFDFLVKLPPRIRN